MPIRVPQLMLACLVAAACTSCSGFWSRITGETARSEQVKAQETVLQQQVMRFSDQLVERVGGALTGFQNAAGTTAETRLDMQRWKVKQASAAVQIASSQNAVVDAVDMVVLVTLSRGVIEDNWISKYGEATRPILEAYQTQEPIAWKLLDGAVTPEQQTELRDALARWRASNPDVESVAFVRLADIARKGKRTSDSAGQTTGLFGLLGLDPMAGLDPAVREVEQSRMLAERTVYYAQRMPGLISSQAELLAYQLAVEPETRDVLSATTRVSEASRTIANTAATLPEWASRERQAAIDQFMQALQSQQETMRALLVELRQTLEAGTQTSQSLNATVGAVDALVERFKPKEAVPGAPKKPFDINDYTRAAAEFTATARQLEQLVAALDQNVPGVAAAAQKVTAGGRDLVDYAFRRALALIAVMIVGGFGAVLAYRLLVTRLTRRAADRHVSG